MKLLFLLFPVMLSAGSVFGQVSYDRGTTTPILAATTENTAALRSAGSVFERAPSAMESTSKSAYAGRWQTPGTAWFASAGIGGQVYFGDHNKQLSFGKRIAPSFGLSAGKWLNQSFGVRGGLMGFKATGLTQNGSHSNGKIFDASRGLQYQSFHFVNVHADVLFDWTNDIYGEFTDRKYHIIPYAGLGLAMGLSDPKEACVRPNLGVLWTVRISPNLDFTADVRGSMVSDAFDGEKGGRKGEGILSTQFGISYNFK